MTEVAQQPPETFGSAHVPVGDDEDAVADASTSGRAGEVFAVRKRVAPARTLRCRQIRIDVEEACAGDVAFQIELAAAAGIAELPAAVDELVAQAYQLPVGDGGRATDAGWITYTIPPVDVIHAFSNCARS